VTLNLAQTIYQPIISIPENQLLMKTRFTFFHFFVAFIVLCCNTTQAKTCKTDMPKHYQASNIYMDPSVAGFPRIGETSASAFQLISHGRPGQLLLRGQWMDAAQIAGFVAPEINNSKAKIQHLNIYGCEFGKGETGKAAVAYLQKTLGISVSASDDITGRDGDWDLEVGTYVSIKGFENYNGNLQYAAGDDFDGDGVINSIDIDDDNDGVPDATESPACFYTINQWNTLPKPASAVTISSALTTTTSNFSQLLDSINNVSAVAFSNTPAQPIQNVNVYLFTFALPVKLDALYLKFNTATQFAGTTKIQGSNTNNGSDWVDLSAAIAQTAGTNTTANGNVSITTSLKYPVTLNTTTAYKYIRITGVAATNIAAQNASEVYFDFNLSSYIASRYARTTCTDANIDGDNVLPQFDLDNDGDGASDAWEAGATASTTANFQFPDIDANNDGLVDAVDANNDGIVNYVSSYYPNAQNNQISPLLTEICNDGIDNDADGLVDGYDSDCSPLAACSSTKTVNNFEIQQQLVTSTGSYNNYQTPMVADVDRDGVPDIIAFNDAINSISVLNSTTLIPKFSIPNPDGNFGLRPNSLAVGQLDGTGYLEIVYFSSGSKLVVLRYNGSVWQSFTSAAVTGMSGGFATNSTALADFDQDGTPEIYFGNQIFSVNFNCTTQPCITRVIDGSTVGTAFGDGNQGVSTGFSFAYDILPDNECSLCGGLELIAGNQVYAVNVATGQVQLARNFTGAPDATVDGPDLRQLPTLI
jgi:hypothetical protein